MSIDTREDIDRRAGGRRFGPGVFTCLLFLAALAAAPRPAAEESARATPSPKPSPTPSPAPSPAPKPAPPPLRFTDDDLSRYHGSPPAEEEPAAGEVPPPASATAPAPVPAGAAAKGAPPRKPGAPPKAITGTVYPYATDPVARPAAPDPLKKWKDQEANDKFRAEQLEQIRGRLSETQRKLDYLQQKRTAIVNPLVIMPEPGSDEEKQRDARARPKELLDQVEEEIRRTEAEIEELKERLVRLQTRFDPGARER